MPSTCTIEVRSLRVDAGGRTILSVEGLTLPPGLHGLIGPNGSGKTTLLRSLAGITRFQGEARVCGLPPSEARRMVGYMPSTPSVDPLATAWDVVYSGLYGSQGSPEWAVGLVGVGGLLGRRFHTLSGGEQRLVCLARALARRPRVLLLDEPLSFLDIRNAVGILRLLRRLAGDTVILASAHQLHYISAFDTVTLLDRGRMAYHGPPSRLTSGLLERVYGVRVREVFLDGVKVFLPADPALTGASGRGDIQP